MIKTKELKLTPEKINELAQEIYDDDDDDEQFLCMYQDKFFVSRLHLLRQPSMEVSPNCKLGCLYVDFIAAKRIIGVDKLNALLTIEVEL